ncbi:hypothetical protein CCB80_09455 [Armatimonadetes bacterium Uphvl-Ar1]|nr:hypothetical protein CCB80_09455 [Armatimonadetes bacterium Uphvl-Ar1]
MLAGLLSVALIQDAPDVSAELVVPYSVVRAGETFPVGVRLDVEEPWHVYWVNPGDTGIQTRMKWYLPDGWRVSEPMFPSPKKYVDGDIVSYVHEGKVDFVVWVTVPESARSGSSVDLKGVVSWLACIESCIPGSAEVQSLVRVGRQMIPDLGKSERLAAMRSGLPKRIDREVRVWREGSGDFKLEVRGVSAESAFFFSESADWVEPGPSKWLRSRMDG